MILVVIVFELWVEVVVGLVAVVMSALVVVVVCVVMVGVVLVHVARLKCDS